MARASKKNFATPPPLRLWLLGPPTIELGKQSLASQLNIRARALIYYLVMKRRTHTRDELATLFWGNMPNNQARKNLRNVLPSLRLALSSHLIITHHTVTFNSHTPYWLDVDIFCNLLIPPLETLVTDRLWEAVAQYRGDFLQGFGVCSAPQFEEWMLLERERLRTMVIAALEVLANRHIHEHDYQGGLAATRHLLELEPWHETAHQQHMLLLALQGRRGAAQEQYRICCRILQMELGLEPLPETTALYRRIQSGDMNDLLNIQIPDQPTAESVDNRTSSPVVATPALAHATNPWTAPASPPLNHMCISPDGNLVAECVHSQHTITLWDINTGNVYTVLEKPGMDITAMAFGTNGVLVSGSADGMLSLWDIASGELCYTLSQQGAYITALAFSPDGTLLVSGSADGMLSLWEVATGRLRHRLRGPTESIITLSFSPHRNTLMSGYNDRSVRVWHLQTGTCLATLDCARRNDS